MGEIKAKGHPAKMDAITQQLQDLVISRLLDMGEIRNEDPITTRFTAEFFLQCAQEGGEVITDEVEGQFVFVGWKLGKLFISISIEHRHKTVTAFIDDGPESEQNNAFFVSYHYPTDDEDPGNGLLVIGG